MKTQKVLTCFMLALLPMLLFAQLPSGNWDLIFEDNFNGSSLDQSKWSYNYPWGNGHRHNHEAWCVAEQVTVQNGHLRITATDQKHPDSEAGYDWTSGVITTAGKFHMDEGYLEGRFRMPPTLGTWPAFWTLGDGWPPEIDVLEVPHERNKYYYNLHYTNSSGDHASFGGSRTGPDLSAGWHIYGVEWDVNENYIRFYFDGQQVASYNNRSEVSQAVNQYILINLAVGGWGGTPASGPWPCYFDCDWVRAWQKAPGSGNGITSGATYRINPRSGSSLDVNTSQNNLQTYSYWGGSNQKFIVTDVGSGYYRVSPVSNSGQAWDVAGQSTSNGANVGTYSYWGGNNQQWEINDLGNGYYSIINRNSGKSLDVNTSSGNVIQYDYWGGQNQQFQFTPVSSGSRTTDETSEIVGAEETLIMFPNPVSDKLNLTLPEEYAKSAEIQVVNSTGQIVLKKSNVESISSGLDVRELSTGIYFLKISNGINSITRKFVKK